MAFLHRYLSAHGLCVCRVGYLWVICFFFCVATVSSLAAEVDSVCVTEIEELMVVAPRVQKEIIPVQELSGVRLEQLSVHSVADAVRYFSGVQIKDFGGVGGLKTVNIRSMGSHHVGVFYDGVQLGNAQNGVIDLGRFSLDNMEAVSMYNGQKSAIFQPAKDFGSASAIYLKTRTPHFADSKPYNLNLSLKGGSFLTINPSVLWEQRVSEKVSTSLSAEYLYTSGEYKFSYAMKDGYDTTAVRQNGDVRMMRVEGGVFGEIEQGEWRLKAYCYDSERGYPGAFVREEPGRFKNEDRQWDTNVFVQGSVRKSVSEHYRFLFNAKYAYDYLHYLSDPRLDVSTMHVDNVYRQHEVYGSMVNMFTIFDWWAASLAVDYQRNYLDANLVNFVYPVRNSLLSAVATSFSFDRVKCQASILHTYVNDQTRITNANAASRSIFTPTIVVSYIPFSAIDLNLRAFYKRVFRMPTLNDLYYTFIGNTELNPEYTNQYNLGVTYGVDFTTRFLQRIELQADVYYNQVEDKIIAMPTSNQFRWTMLNLGYVEIRGVDAAAQAYASVGKVNMSLRANYTYQRAQDMTDVDDEFYGGQIPYIPWHSGSVIVGADYCGWNLNYSFIYTGERYESVANIPENYGQPWYTHDISLSKDFTIKQMKWRITAEVNNILNQQYEVVQCYPMPGINFKLKLNVKF